MLTQDLHMQKGQALQKGGRGGCGMTYIYGAWRTQLTARLIDEVPGHDGGVITVQAPIDGVHAIDDCLHIGLVGLFDEGVSEEAKVLLP